MYKSTKSGENIFNSNYSIETKGISKNYGETRALDNISLQIPKGELFGIIGPDGGGKSSLFHVLTTLVLPDNGSARVMGADIIKDYTYIRRNLGYMPGSNSVYNDLSIEENLKFYATVYGSTLKESYDIIRDIYVQIEPFKSRPAGKLSGGMKQKLALCCAIIHKPELLILDEPTTGVDAVSRREFWDTIKKLNTEGMSIIASTPYMDEARMCSHISLMQGGKILATDTPDHLPTTYPKPLYAVSSNDFYRLLLDLQDWHETFSVFTFGQYLHFTPNNNQFEMNALRVYLEEKKHQQIYIEGIRATIEDCFMYFLQQKNE
jgi:ABC-type multidrug transport system ATPase subunit